MTFNLAEKEPMVYLFGTLGFIAGFILGQMVLAYLLRGVSRDRLLEDKSLRWKYGLLNWVIAVGTAAAVVWLYDTLFY